MNATQRRLLALAGRRALGALAALTVCHGAVLLLQAELLARAIAGLDPTLLAPLAVTVALRALLGLAGGWLLTGVAHRVLAGLRRGLLAGAGAPLAPTTAGADLTLLTKGVDAIGEFFTGYLPQLFAAAVVPLFVLVQLSTVDWPSALIVALTLPLVPVFGVLVGRHTAARTGHQWALLARLGGHFRDVLAGLGTLRAFGRTAHQAGVVRGLAEEHRRHSFAALRVAFLSALSLDLVSSLAVALVAVPVGLRLLDGALSLPVGLLVLLLTPEAYLPLRALGTRFHAAAEGMAAAGPALARVSTVESPRPVGTRTVPAGAPTLELRHVTARYPAAERPALRDVSLTVHAGETLALAGESGAGKSTLLLVLLGLLRPEAGQVLVNGVPLAELDPVQWRRAVAWVPQRPRLFAGTVAENIRLGRPAAGVDEVHAAARAACLDAFVATLPRGYDTPLECLRLSAGQRQRLAVARAHLLGASTVLLDEPTAQLDLHSEHAVVDTALGLLAGRTAVLVAHRPRLLAAADRVGRLADGRIGVVRDPALVSGGAS